MVAPWSRGRLQSLSSSTSLRGAFAGQFPPPCEHAGNAPPEQPHTHNKHGHDEQDDEHSKDEVTVPMQIQPMEFHRQLESNGSFVCKADLTSSHSMCCRILADCGRRKVWQS